MIDFIVFGGDEFVCYFFVQSQNTLFRQQPTEELIERFETFACLSDIAESSFEYFRDNDIVPHASQKIVDNYMSLLSGRYLEYDKNDDRYKEPVKMKQLFESKSRLVIEKARVYEKWNTVRKSTIGCMIASLPIACTDIIAEYEYTPRYNVIDWANFKKQ